MKICVVGGAGFIGVHTADFFARQGHEIIVFDNLSRRGTTRNLEWLLERHPGLHFVRGDITMPADLDRLTLRFPDISVIIHLAGQVAVTSSVRDPVADFKANAEGTLHLLEAARSLAQPPIFLFASTNKVYGGLEHIAVEEGAKRCRYRDFPRGIAEDMPLDFHSPYGCSKGAADQYVRDYARIYGLRTVVFRQSCIYGTRQFGIEDQGWVAGFTISAILGRPITIYGSGKQVRDLLHVEDLVRAYQAAIERIDTAAGRIYNAGGGPEFSLSLLELLERLESVIGAKIPVRRGDWRAGDQRIFIADTRRAREELGWTPRIDPAEGLRQLCEWVRQNSDLIRRELDIALETPPPPHRQIESLPFP